MSEQTLGRTYVRDARRDDLGRIVQLWQEAGFVPRGPDGLTIDQAVDAMLADDVVGLVAEDEGRIVGAVAGAPVGPIGVLLRAATVGPTATDALDRLIDRLEAILSERGARIVVVRTGLETPMYKAFLERGYAQPERWVSLERALPHTVAGPSDVARLGGRIIEPDLWDRLRGMEQAKDIIERRVILPLSEPELAHRHGVAPPKAIVLFGPPGTGKTTFAKGIASRLRWPFVELQPAEMGGSPEGAAKRLADAFDLILQLPSVVVFVDEVEDVASVRHEQRRVGPSVTNEFLRQIPRLREVPHHLLVCATNLVGRLDPAFIRPGRFDYILPVGPPDAQARAAIWGRYVEEITTEAVDLDAIVAASEWFTPADIEFAAQKAAHIAFERAYFDEVDQQATTRDFLDAIAETRPSLSEDAITAFQHDVESFARY